MARRIWASVLGGYHRPRFLRHTLRDVEKGIIRFGDAEEKIKIATAEVVGVQVASGMRYVVDGMLDWHDIFRPFVNAWRNVYPNGLLRYFDNNFFYRIPVFLDEPEPSKLILPPRIMLLKEIAEPAEIKVVIPGPLTFTLLSRNESNLSKQDLAKSIAKVLNLELRLALEVGAKAIQIDEPVLSDPYLEEEDIELLNELLDVVLNGIEAFKILATYFGVPSERTYKELVESKVNAIVLSITENPKRFLNLINEFGVGDKIPILGVINSRDIYDDEYQSVLNVVRSVLNILKAEGIEEIGLTTSSWLDLIPFTYSLRKTYILGSYTERIAKELMLEFLSPTRIV